MSTGNEHGPADGMQPQFGAMRTIVSIDDRGDTVTAPEKIIEAAQDCIQAGMYDDWIAERHYSGAKPEGLAFEMFVFGAMFALTKERGWE